MDVPLTVPGVFYDLIARIVPGYFVLILIRLSFPKIYERAADKIDIGKGEGFAVLAVAASVIVICYLLGWFLRGFGLITHLPALIRPSEPSGLRRRYQAVKVRSESVGYRLLKLRAEASMLEACVMAVIMVGVLAAAFGIASLPHSDLQHFWTVAGRVVAYTIVASSFIAADRKAQHRYYETVDVNYELLVVSDAAMVKGTDTTNISPVPTSKLPIADVSSSSVMEVPTATPATSNKKEDLSSGSE